MSSTTGIIAFVVALLVAIAFHEFGHFITARWSGIKVSRFFVGFGPTLWSVRRGRPETVVGPDGTSVVRPETELGVKALPLGGFVKVVGMSPGEEVPPEDVPRSFGAAPAWKRAIVLSAGSATHFITAIALLFVVFTFIGVPDVDRPTLLVEAVSSQIGDQPSPALEAGLQPGDEVVAINGRPIGDWDELTQTIRANPGRSLDLSLRSREGTRTVSIVPVRQEVSDLGEIGVIGVLPRYEVERLGPVDGVRRSMGVIGSFFVSLGEVAPRAFSPSSLGLTGEGPSDERAISIIGAGRLAGDVAAQGGLIELLGLFVVINLAIGVFNLLPLLPLDGGHLLLLGVEKIRRKAPQPETVMRFMAVGATLLGALFLILIYNDIVRPPSLPGP